MLEKILFGELSLPGEFIRIFVAFLGLAITSYYDLFNNKNIPEKILFIFIVAALIVNFYFFDQDLSIFALGLAVVLGIIGYAFHKLGQLGSADVIVISAVSLLLPIHPSLSDMPFNYPFILSLLVFSGVLFALYTVINFGFKLMKQKKTKPNILALVILLPYLLFVYVYFQFPLFSAAYFTIVSVIVVSTMFFLTYKQDINKLLVEKVPLKKVEEEDVLAIEFMNKKFVEKYKPERVLTTKELKRLKKLKVKTLWIFTHLPPFLPFLLIGFILSLFFSNLLLG